MTNIFIDLCNRSIQAGYLIIAIILLRIAWKRAPKLLYRYLWCLVGLRLTLPFTLETVFSLIPKKSVIKPEILYSQNPSVDTGIEIINPAVNVVIAQNFTPDVTASVNPLQIVMVVCAWVWFIGLVVLLLYSVISYIRLHYRMRDAVLLTENIYQSEKVNSPFVFGFIKPRIYLSYSLEEENRAYVIAHEKMHIERKDYLLKPIAFLILAVYWFNPLVWIAYYLFCKDVELCCDEWVIWNLPVEEKKAYAKALVMCSTDRKLGYISPLAFGENAVKERIKNILHYKNPTLWGFVGICVVVLVAVICFMTNPREENENNVMSDDGTMMGDVTPEGSQEDKLNESEGHNNSSKSTDSSLINLTVPVLLKEPPMLGFSDMLSSQMNQFVISHNGADWIYIDAPLTDEGVYDLVNGNEVGMASTGLYPTVAAKTVEWLKLQEYQGVDSWLYRLTSNVLPDEVVVREYSLYELGDEYAEVRSEKRYTKDNLLIELIPARIYEITAIWDKSHYEECGYYGEARYILVTDTELGTYDEIRQYQSQMMNTVKIYAHIKEIYGNKILISSDTDEFPGAFEVIIPEEVCNMEDLQGGQDILIRMYDTGMVNENGRIPVYQATELRIHVVEEPEDILLDDIVNSEYEVNNLDGVTLQMEKYNSSGGDVEIRNTTDKDIRFGEWFELQVQVNDRWFALPYRIDNAAFYEVAYGAPKDETIIHEVDWSWLYGELPKGTYRIVKDVMDFRGTGDYTKYYLADEFSIK